MTNEIHFDLQNEDHKKHWEKKKDDEGFLDWKNEYYWYQWQLLKRNPEYIDYCCKHKFDDNELIIVTDENKQEIEETKKRWGLQEIWHFKKELSKEVCSASGVFIQASAVQRIFLDNNQKGVPDWQHYIDIRINIDDKVRWKQIEGELRRLIDYAKIMRGLSPFGEERLHFDEDLLQVWDLKKRRESFEEIALQLYPSELLATTKERAKKKYYKAYELILHKEYDPERKKQDIILRKEELKKYCTICTDKTCLKDGIPCHEISLLLEPEYVPGSQYVFPDR